MVPEVGVLLDRLVPEVTLVCSLTSEPEDSDLEDSEVLEGVLLLEEVEDEVPVVTLLKDLELEVETLLSDVAEEGVLLLEELVEAVEDDSVEDSEEGVLLEEEAL